MTTRFETASLWLENMVVVGKTTTTTTTTTTTPSATSTASSSTTATASASDSASSSSACSSSSSSSSNTGGGGCNGGSKRRAMYCWLASLLVWTVAVVLRVHLHGQLFSNGTSNSNSNSNSVFAVADVATGKTILNEEEGEDEGNQRYNRFEREIAPGPAVASPQIIIPMPAPPAAVSLPLAPGLPPNYRMDWSTEDNYESLVAPAAPSSSSTITGAATAVACQGGSFGDIRQSLLDHTYHKIYSCQRQLFQDQIIKSKLQLLELPKTNSMESSSSSNSNININGNINGRARRTDCNATTTATKTNNTLLTGEQKQQRRNNWIVFTAGVMGAGKSFTIRQLDEKGRFPLHQFVTVDPDGVRRLLPEFEKYVQVAPELAGELTRKESGMISELLTEAALRRGQNVLVDGTLRNSTWYETYFDDLRHRYPHLRIGILHVTAPREAVLDRAMSRAKVTGRVVPRDLLEHTMLEVPRSIEILAQKVDFAVQLLNAPGLADVEIMTKGVTWKSFTNMWTSTATTTTSSSSLCAS